MNGQQERRDDALGAALRRLEVPDHAPGFHQALRAVLEREAARRDVRGRDGRPVHLPSRPRGRPPLRRRWRWQLLAAAAMTTLAVLAVTIVVPGGDPGVARAAEVRARAARAWASAEALSGVMTTKRYASPGFSPAREEERWRFLLTARGDFRLTSLTRPGEVAYDAGTNVERSLSPSQSIPDSDVLFASEISGLAPGAPDPGPSTSALDRGIGSVVRALATGTGGEVREVVHEGREAWLLETTVPGRSDILPDRLLVTVDEETGLPVRMVASRAGRPLYETTIQDLTVDPPVPPDAFRLEFPKAAEVFRTDHGFRRIPSDEVAHAVAHDPLIPAWSPEGYRLDEVMVSTRPSVVGAENPPVGDIVSLSYRRGLDRFTVTTRPAAGKGAAWSDPFYTVGGPATEPEEVRLSAGALVGRSAEVVIDPMSLAPPHLWASTDGIVVTVAGALTRSELLRVAESLA